MIQNILRFLKRSAVLLPGLVIVYFSIRKIFPLFDRRLPAGVAILFTYIVGAYILAPALIRLFRILVPAKHLPLYCVTPDGFASDPLNIGIIGTRRNLITAMETAGWHVADSHHWRNLIRHGLSTVYGWSYPSAPVSNLYLFGRKQDIAFEIPIVGQMGSRHHVRFWATTYSGEQPTTFQSIRWQRRSEHVNDDNLLWVGAASQDIGIGYIRHNLQITHMIDPDTDQERELIVTQLRKQKLVSKTTQIKLGKPYKLINRVLSGSLHSDGKMSIVQLKKLKQPKV